MDGTHEMITIFNIFSTGLYKETFSLASIRCDGSVRITYKRLSTRMFRVVLKRSRIFLDVFCSIRNFLLTYLMSKMIYENKQEEKHGHEKFRQVEAAENM